MLVKYNHKRYRLLLVLENKFLLTRFWLISHQILQQFRFVFHLNKFVIIIYCFVKSKQHVYVIKIKKFHLPLVRLYFHKRLHKKYISAVCYIHFNRLISHCIEKLQIIQHWGYWWRSWLLIFVGSSLFYWRYEVSIIQNKVRLKD